MTISSAYTYTCVFSVGTDSAISAVAILNNKGLSGSPCRMVNIQTLKMLVMLVTVMTVMIGALPLTTKKIATSSMSHGNKSVAGSSHG